MSSAPQKCKSVLGAANAQEFWRDTFLSNGCPDFSVILRVETGE
jgi:hypothetical protein